MNKKPLYDINERWTDKCFDLSNEVSKALKPIVDKWLAEGYANREIESVILAEVNDMMVCARICDEPRIVSAGEHLRGGV